MPTATLTLKISGTVAGKALSFSHDRTINYDTPIERIGMSIKNSSITTHDSSGSGATPVVDQDHDMLMIANVGTRAPMTTSLGGILSVHLQPGEFFVLQKATAGGVLNSSATATTSTCVAVTFIEPARTNAALGAPQFHILGTYNYAS